MRIEQVLFDATIDNPGEAVRRYALTRDGAPIAYGDVVTLWRWNESFRRYFVELLARSPYACYRFESPALTRGAAGQPFEFVLIHSPEIDVPADAGDFRGHFARQHDDVLVFDNLGGDATLIVPRPRADTPGYSHIGDFVRHAPAAQQTLLWRTVGEALHDRLGDSPLWLSTAGGGVPWLHVRIDTRPKYYVFGDYRSVPER